MQLIRYLILLAATGTVHAAEQPLQTAVSWMAEAQPFDPAAIERHFGATVKARCAGVTGAIECIASGNNVEVHWRPGGKDAGIRDGHALLQLDGCTSRRDIERVLAAPLRFSPGTLPENSAAVTLSARHWVAGRTFRVDVRFDKRCARQLTIAPLAF